MNKEHGRGKVEHAKAVRRSAKLMIALMALLPWCNAVTAQPRELPRPVVPDCPPDVRGSSPPTVGSTAPNLSDKLSESKGIICPPAGVDPEMAVPPPAGGTLKVIPPPGSPGGDPTVQPK